MYNIMMPPGGQTTDESLIAKWRKQVGDKIKRGDILFEIETDKATLEVESYCEGYLRAVRYLEGEKASTGEIVAFVGEKEEPVPGDPLKGIQDEYRPILSSKKNVPMTDSNQSTSEKVMASPRAKKAAKDNQLELSDIKSRTGIIKSEDILSHVNQALPDALEYEKIPMSNMRKIISRRMCESVNLAPHYTITMDIDMSACIRLRTQINEYLDGIIKITFNDLIIKCTAKAMEKNPMINVSLEGDEIKVYRNVNVGLAVGMEHGLVVPVVKCVNKKSLSEIAEENRINIDKAQSGTLSSDAMSGGTITVSNLGMFGVDDFTAVINQPESCILAVGAIAEKAVSVNSEIRSRNIMTITASFDHRVIDGMVGAQFLKTVKMFLENPGLLLV